MCTPWQEIPLLDYEAHMSLPSVGQAGMLADQLAQLIERHTPTSVAIIGCAGGNGLERIDSTRVERVVAIDINPEYVAATERRHADQSANLDCRCADVQSETLLFDPVELIYAALIFEYVDIAATFATLKRNLQPGGTVAVILQLPHSDQHAVSASPYRSLDKLVPAMKLVELDELRSYARAAGFTVGSSNRIDLPSGKQFWMQICRG
jgi:trans-aconitate methyltransferase